MCTEAQGSEFAPRQMAGLPLLLCYLADRHAANAAALPPEGSAPASAIRILVWSSRGCNRSVL
jgi:hypothetical protein